MSWDNLSKRAVSTKEKKKVKNKDTGKKVAAIDNEERKRQNRLRQFGENTSDDIPSISYLPHIL